MNQCAEAITAPALPWTWEAKLVLLMNLWGEDELLGRVLAAIHELCPYEAHSKERTVCNLTQAHSSS